MLTSLFINNIVLIERLEINLTNGFCVLTGETGAGKSILLDALGLALGKRASAGMIRLGQTQGSVTATFDINKNISDILAEQGIDSDGEVFLRRVIFADGKSKSFINDVPVSVNLLGDIAEQLIEIHGQHDQRGLLSPATHRTVIDEYGNLDKLLADVRGKFSNFNGLKLKLQQLKEDEAKAAAEEDYLKFVLKELQDLKPRSGLEEELANARSGLINRDKLVDAVNQSASSIQDGNAEKSLQAAQNILLKNVEFNHNFQAIADMLERALIEISEALSGLQSEAASIDDASGNLDEIEERLFALRAASRKYNVASDDLDGYKDEVAAKLDLLVNKDIVLDALQKDVEKARADYLQAAQKLSAERQKAAVKLEKALSGELTPLKMANTRLKVDFEDLAEENWTAEGINKIAFLVSTNPAAPFAPIAKVASGGELSRLMLALKVVLSGVKSVPTMIFDEVDTGIGGAVADAVGERLAVLAKKLQVLVITHQPQVAAKGNLHLQVSKSETKSGTTTNVRVLSENERREELARMLSGREITGEARAAAERLLAVVEC
jgi:DNA repair protein RecN (Recombination protein N)